ncbi:prolyl 4-hydroxylase [Polaromonas sp. YR568]|uniref:2OG-Fe(II) oxygenase n=1 Tax=Polaromonas sp. YR568 TaxID=1855301 RepID=UPI0008F1666E|nr:2OG-Fe(II) oxygenase [Polaromonas sp. YR568]SFU89275.1 prolyl 4-hydroxylase [Polaromonas sp. YR568]
MKPGAAQNQAHGPAPGQAITREMRAWVSAQLAGGHSPDEIHRALVDAGWQAAAASQALGLPVDGATPSPPVAVPVVTPDAGGAMVDTGDKWVEVREHREAPDLWVFSNLLSPAECTALMDAAAPRLERSRTVDTQTGGEELNHDRTSHGMFYTRGETEVVSRIEARIARLLNWPVQNGEGLQVLRYRRGAEYKPHYDYFDPGEPGTAKILQRGGQRVASLIMYLQEPEAGGATVFPDIGLKVRPQRGSAVFFSYPRAHPVSLTLHGGEPVRAGEKWIATKWLREREFT